MLKNLLTKVNFPVLTLLSIFQKNYFLLLDPSIGRGREEERKGERRIGKEGGRRLEIAGVSPLHTPRK